jgi:hypothetical protein
MSLQEIEMKNYIRPNLIKGGSLYLGIPLETIPVQVNAKKFREFFIVLL